MLCWRRISAIGTPASPCFRISTIWLSVNRDFRMGISLAPESLRSKCLLKGEAYAGICIFARKFSGRNVFQWLRFELFYMNPLMPYCAVQSRGVLESLFRNLDDYVELILRYG